MKAELEAVLFDLDDTLVASSAGDSAALADTLRRNRHRFHDADLDALVAAHDAILVDVKSDFVQGKPWRYPPERFAALLGRFGADARHAVALAEDYYDTRARLLRPYPGARELVADLKAAGFRLGLVTNGPVHSQRRSIEAVGIARAFDAIVVAGEVGLRKPDPAIFHLALEKLDAAPERAMMIGDSYAMDIAPAVALGMRAALVTGTGAERRSYLFDGGGPRDGPCDLKVRSVAELRTFLL